MRIVPKLTNPDGSRLACGALCTSNYFYTFEKTPKTHPHYCQRAAIYPDKRCAYHTAWLTGNGRERRRADNRSVMPRARKVAWTIYKQALTGTELALPKGFKITPVNELINVEEKK